MSSATRNRSATAYVVVLSVLLAIYAASAPRTLPEADSGELAAVAVCGGIAHPPGYPLLSLALQLFARLSPVLGLIPALSALSILCAGAAAWISMEVLIRRGYSALIAGAATLAVFLSSHVWRAATSFEPFALNLLLAAGVLWACERLLRCTTSARAEAATLTGLGTLFGLGLCNHHSLVTLMPLALCALWSQPKALARRVSLFFFGAVVGATPLFAFLQLRLQPGFVWGDWQELGPRLLQHVLRREYGSFALAPIESAGSWTYGPARLVATLPRALSFGFLLPLCVGFIRLAIRAWSPRSHERRLDLGIALSLLTSGLFLPLLFRLKGTELDNLIADRFFALPIWLMLLPIADGLRELLKSAPKQGLICSVALAIHTSLVWPLAERRTHQFYENHVRNIFELLPQNATLIVVADGGFAGGLYGRCVLQRDDVQLVIASLGQRWYLERLAAARRDADLPLYLLDIPDVQRTRPPATFPVGPLLRAITGDASLPRAREMFEQNRALFERLRLPTREEIGAFDAWEAEELTYYWRSWHLIGQRLEAEGEHVLATTAYGFRDQFKR